MVGGGVGVGMTGALVVGVEVVFTNGIGAVITGVEVGEVGLLLGVVPETDGLTFETLPAASYAATE